MDGNDMIFGYLFTVKNHTIDTNEHFIHGLKERAELLILHETEFGSRWRQFKSLLFPKRRMKRLLMPYKRWVNQEPENEITITLENGYAWVFVEEKYIISPWNLERVKKAQDWVKLELDTLSD